MYDPADGYTVHMDTSLLVMSDPLRSDENEYEGLFDQIVATVSEPIATNEPEWKRRFAGRKISPRVRIAARLYNTGIARTLGEAAKMAGLAPATLYAMNVSDNEEYNRIASQAAKDSDIATGDISAVLQRLGRNALITIEALRASSESEAIRLKAAIDLADRSPETSKIQKMQVQTITMEGKDVAELTRGMIEAAQVQAQFTEVTTGDFVKVTTESHAPQLSLPTPHTGEPDESVSIPDEPASVVG